MTRHLVGGARTFVTRLYSTTEQLPLIPHKNISLKPPIALPIGLAD